jgi:hypothetical protein
VNARTGVCLFKVLTAVCFAIAVMAGVTDRVVAATQTPLAQPLAASCPHPLDDLRLPTWKPTELELHRILARHSGWLQKMGYIDLQARNEYLDHVKPAYPDWRREARSHPEQANLCNADLIDATLDGAQLRDADLSGAHLSGAHLRDADLRGAYLSGAFLRGANLRHAELSGAYLRGAYLSDANLSGAYLRGANLSHAHLNHAELSGAHLSGENLSRANLSRANLSRANLLDAHR